jgi:HD superfamily phosphohydrolase
MKIQDILYGTVEIPEWAEPFLETPTLQRLKNVSQDSMPNGWMNYQFPSRYEHSVNGVFWLMLTALEENVLSVAHKRLLLVAALLHDAGNPCFCHLGEIFLKMLNGHNGESFFAVILLRDAKLRKLLAKEGISEERLLRVITGKEKSLSDILHGSLDVDNIDNVSRYWKRMSNQNPTFSPLALASQFRFLDGAQSGWALAEEAQQAASQWQILRKILYSRFIYGEPHMASASMLYRAVSLAHYGGFLNEDFYHLDDFDAADFLHALGGQIGEIVALASARRRFKLVLNESQELGGSLSRFASSGDGRTLVADELAKSFGCRAGQVAVYLSVGRAHRDITLPLVTADGSIREFPKQVYNPSYRLKVYLHPDLAFEGNIERFVRITRSFCHLEE